MTLLKRRKIGALLRCFARTTEQVATAVAQTMASVRTMQSVKVGDDPFVRRIEILVPTDPSYGDTDCGETASALRAALADAGFENVYVSEVENADIFVGILNYGMAKLLRDGCRYALILSKEAETYCGPEAAADIIEALERKAKVAGIALNELTDSIMQGRIANTFAVWDIEALMQVGLFDWRCRKPKKDAPIVSRAQAWSTEKEFWHYDLAGVEEIVPLIRLVRTFGSCIAPILPRGDGMKVWQAPDPEKDKEGYLRHINKMGTKLERQAYFAGTENADLSILKGGVMAEYRNPAYINSAAKGV